MVTATVKAVSQRRALGKDAENLIKNAGKNAGRGQQLINQGLGNLFGK